MNKQYRSCFGEMKYYIIYNQGFDGRYQRKLSQLPQTRARFWYLTVSYLTISREIKHSRARGQKLGT